MYLIFCINGSSISWTLYPQIDPVISEAAGLKAGACAKKVSRSTSVSRTLRSPASS
jgi:hypothetical protein